MPGLASPADLSARRFFGSLWDELSSLDSRSWRTLKALMIPGELTRAAFAGQRQRYLPPLRLYLIASAVFFFLAWDVYYAMMVDTLQRNPAAQPAQFLALISDPVAAGRVADLNAWLRFGTVVLLGLGVAVLFWRRRWPLGAHLIFAAHYYCVDFFLFSLLAIPVSLAGSAQRASYDGLINLGLLVLLGYLIAALRRAYQVRWIGAMIRGLALLLLDLLLSTTANQAAILLVAALR